LTINAIDKKFALVGESCSFSNLAACRTSVVYDGVVENPDSLYIYLVYPITSGGIFDNDTIPNTSARWRIISSDSPERWEWFNGGGYIFDAAGASTGTYVATYEVKNWDGLGNNATSTVTVTVTA